MHNDSSREGVATVEHTAASDHSELQLVTFEVASEEYAIDILSVREINRMLELTHVPQSPPEVEGVINLRGKIIPVLDMRKKFGIEQAQRDNNSRIVVVDVAGRVLGFIVDRVHEVLRISSDIVEPAPDMIGAADTEYISGVGKLNDRLIILLNLQKLFADTEALIK